MNSKYRKLIITCISIFIVTILFTSICISVSGNNKNKSIEKSTDNDTLILGFSQIGSESAWRTRNTQSIIEAAAANNIKLIFDDAQQKQENQLKAIRSFIVYQVDVIAFVPIVADGWDKVLQEAKDANIPVIIVDRQINADPSLYAGFLGEDGFLEGQKAAAFLVEKCSKKNTPINVLELSGTANSSVAIERAQGFRSGIASKPNINIIHSEDGDFLISRGKEIMDRIITENKGLYIGNQPIDVIYSHNDSMTLGLLDSFSNNKIAAENTILISIDGEQKSIDALVAGKLNCVVECNPNQGESLMHLVQLIAEGKQIPPVTYINETIFTENDDFSTYEPRGY